MTGHWRSVKDNCLAAEKHTGLRGDVTPSDRTTGVYSEQQSGSGLRSGTDDCEDTKKPMNHVGLRRD